MTKKLIFSVFGVLCVVLSLMWRINYDNGNFNKGDDDYIHPVYDLVTYLSNLGDNSFDNAVLKPTVDVLDDVRTSWSSSVTGIDDFFEKFGKIFEVICIPIQIIYNAVAWITNISASVSAFFFTGSFEFSVLPVWKFVNSDIGSGLGNGHGGGGATGR